MEYKFRMGKVDLNAYFSIIKKVYTEKMLFTALFIDIL